LQKSNEIYQKLENFIKKFYTNELIRGIIFFVGLGLCYFLFTIFVEFFLWLKPTARTILFYTFILVELILLIRYIIFPFSKLFKLQKGIDYNDASAIIGNHFSEVSDKLTNFLQLSDDQNQSELLAASIEQKANSLQPIPFGNAINFNKNKKFLPLVIIPILFFLFFYFSGNGNILTASLNRVTHYKQQFLPPAPFKFVVLNPNLLTEQNQDFILKVKSVGSVIPSDAMIFIDNASYFMVKTAANEFEFKITKPTENVPFHIEAGEVQSAEYELSVIIVPSIANFEMLLNFPSYLNKKAETIKGTGNAIIPEGTRVSWKMNTHATQSVDWISPIGKQSFVKAENTFALSKNIFENTEYQIVTSNSKVKNYEKLAYQISVIKDQFPTITVNNAPDSLKVDKNFVFGQIADDYGFSKLQVVYYQKDKPETAKRGTIAVKKDIYDQFVFAFPSNLPVQEGISYEYYFEIFDNDAIHNYKSTKSTTFTNRIATEEEKQDNLLQEQNDNINSLEKSLKSQTKQISELEKLQKTNKEKDNLEFKDQQKINDFIKKQQQQEELMKQFAEKLKDNLDKTKSDKKNELKEEIEKRLDKIDKDYEKNKKLLEELKQLNEKIKQEDLTEKMDKFKQNAKTQSKSLEQLVELTKKYYVQKKAEQIKEKLDKLADKQEDLSNKDKENSTEKQDEINKDFDKIQEELKELDKENKELKKPMDIPQDKETEKSIDEDLKKASDELQKDKKDSAKPKQKSAAKKMKQMSQKMEQSMESGEMEQMEEDVEMLRQVLDNLLAFSFSQEDLMKQFGNIKRGSPSFSKNLKIQQDLKQEFTHVDDSLFALSLRNPKFGDEITKQVGEVHYNLDKSLESLADAQIPKGVSHQQYTTTSANKLADFLTDLLNNMQQSMSGMGMGKPKKGKGEGDMQLPDIIKKQGELGEKAKKGKGKKPGEGDKPGQGDNPGSEGQEGKSGEGEGQGKDGKEGNSGEGKSGKDGKSGQGSGSGQGGKDGNKDGENGEDGEGNAKEIMEIYKEQQQLREQLQNELNKRGIGGAGQNAIDQMKDIEKQLLNKGFKNDVLQKILNVKQELLKLDKAIQEQGQEEKRQSETNKKEFNNTATPLPKSLQDYLKSIEILNRQSLPLRSNFNQKVQEYFKKNE
jgi:hypothetical protein